MIHADCSVPIAGRNISCPTGNHFLCRQMDYLEQPHHHSPRTVSYHLDAFSFVASKLINLCSFLCTPPTWLSRYIVPSLVHQALPGWFRCSTNHLRWMNAALLCALPLLISRVLSHFRTTPYPPRPGVKPRVRFLIPEDEIILEAIIISSFPITYFSGFLFYTDIGSLFAVIASYHQSLARHHVLAALVSRHLLHLSPLFHYSLRNNFLSLFQLGLWSCLFRQTNIVWVAFIAGSALINHLRQIASTAPSHATNQPKKTHRPVQPYDLALMSASLRVHPRSRFYIFPSC